MGSRLSDPSLRGASKGRELACESVWPCTHQRHPGPRPRCGAVKGCALGGSMVTPRERCERRNQSRRHQSPDGRHGEGHTAESREWRCRARSRAESLLANGGARCSPFPRAGGRDRACAVIDGVGAWWYFALRRTGGRAGQQSSQNTPIPRGSKEPVGGIAHTPPNAWPNVGHASPGLERARAGLGSCQLRLEFSSECAGGRVLPA